MAAIGCVGDDRPVPSHIELELSWTRLGALRLRHGDAKSVVVDPVDAAARIGLAVYRFDFLTSDGALTVGANATAGNDDGNCYVGETTNFERRLETYRYGRGGLHGRLFRRRLIRHFEKNPQGSVDIFVLDQCSASVDGELVVSMAEPSEAQASLTGHTRVLFEQASILAMHNAGRHLINVPPELRQALAAEAKAVAAEIKRARST